MRISIIQAEIEEAIRAYILNQIALKPGQDITVDLKATRGDTGISADIDIKYLGNVEQAKSPQKAVQSRSTAQATKVAPETSTTSPAPDVADTEATTSTTEPSVDNASTTVEETTQTEEVTPALFPAATKAFDAEQPVDADVVAEEPVTKPSASSNVAPVNKSLFANLKKPV